MKNLFVLLGPTGVGKTDLSIAIAQALKSPIISADSRQIYKEIPIGTAAPTLEQQALVPHYFIGTRSVQDEYSAGQYELDALALLTDLFQTHDHLLLTGGSMMYIDAVCQGMDDIPTIQPSIREEVQNLYATQGLNALQQRLQDLDPVHYQKVDLQNYRRVMHAVEVCLQTGAPYSDLLTHEHHERPFKVIKIGLNRDRQELYHRINQRVDIMVQDGLIEEARKVYPMKQLNALNTVGFKELFQFWDGELESQEQALDLIRQHSRNYAKRQLTWFKRDADIHWFHPQEETPLMDFIRKNS